MPRRSGFSLDLNNMAWHIGRACCCAAGAAGFESLTVRPWMANGQVQYPAVQQQVSELLPAVAQNKARARKIARLARRRRCKPCRSAVFSLRGRRKWRAVCIGRKPCRAGGHAPGRFHQLQFPPSGMARAKWCLGLDTVQQEASGLISRRANSIHLPATEVACRERCSQRHKGRLAASRGTGLRKSA